MNPQIKQLKQQIEQKQQTLNASINRVKKMLEEERAYTESLVQKATKPAAETAPQPPTQPAHSKAEEISQMTDRQLLEAMKNPQARQALLKDLG